MSGPLLHAVVSLVAVVIAVILVFFVSRNKKENHLTVLAWLGFAFLILGIVVGARPIPSYALMAVGVVLTVINVFIKPKTG